MQIGNAVINEETDVSGMVDFAWSHAIISDKMYNGIKKHCDFKQTAATSECNTHIKGFGEAYAYIDIYSIYSPLCLEISGQSPKLNVAPRLLTQHVSTMPYL